ncbi:succinate--CoA ligase subunit alpha [Desulfonatronospira sp. MSAO_Bac3]|uniref:succinate--CoA ligase subunit alpha n=1 Tax=Desulfonatronospira sp. MSAO_Bac3 TaxID=2293857 RepID=UPI000FF82CBF|nr:succinate--CoA ligase subunit alpha [Desulfonatronospira sp. MSAO_Bac3]RQD77738.1 MAG: succinate--CoA ligase subunit alpha [Desulfonatronospira sp. MSAO_Bac3]
MKLNEHMSKELLKGAGILVPRGEMIGPGDISDFAPEFELPWVVKAMVLTGGRGKAGGVRVVQNREEFETAARQILGMQIKGESVPFVRVEPASHIQREMYLSMTLDRQQKSLVLTAGRTGGVDIESSGRDNILSLTLDPGLGLHDFQIRRVFFHLDLDKSMFRSFSGLLKNLYTAFTQNRLLLAEINPLVLTGGQELTALDGKVELDDNYVQINRGLLGYHVPEHLGEQERLAGEAGLSYHRLDGRVGMVVNGAGLAMATMDLLNFSGVPAANFLDLGGGADQERISRALDILFNDPGVELVFINIFGGILSCEKVALALAAALEEASVARPMVVRFSGFKAREAGRIIQGLNADNIYYVQDLARALETLKELSSSPGGGQKFQRIEFPPAQEKKRTPKKNEPAPFPLNKNTPVLVQGITGREGMLHAREMQNFGTRIVAGVTPFKGGSHVEGVPVFDSVHKACMEHDIQASVIFVPGAAAADAVMEAVDMHIPWVVCITEGIPQQDMMRLLPAIRRSGTRLVGPNTPGIMVPGQTKLGIMPASIFSRGPVAILSRSGTLTYECVQSLTSAGMGQCMCLGVGGDPYVGLDFRDIFPLLQRDPACRAVLVLGEIGGTAEEDLARELDEMGFDKPVLGFVAGQTAPPGKRLGHAGAILDEHSGGIRAKLQVMHECGITICPDLASIPAMVEKVL